MVHRARTRSWRSGIAVHRRVGRGDRVDPSMPGRAWAQCRTSQPRNGKETFRANRTSARTGVHDFVSHDLPCSSRIETEKREPSTLWVMESWVRIERWDPSDVMKYPWTSSRLPCTCIATSTFSRPILPFPSRKTTNGSIASNANELFLLFFHIGNESRCWMRACGCVHGMYPRAPVVSTSC